MSPLGSYHLQLPISSEILIPSRSLMIPRTPVFLYDLYHL